MRSEGKSIRAIEKTLNIPRSTLSGWFRGVKLSEEQVTLLEQNRINQLQKARHKAVKWHNNQKKQHLIEAKRQSVISLKNIDTQNKFIRELALAMLYLGEGSKGDSGLSIGSCDPLILNFYIRILIEDFCIERNKIKCYLHLRNDQNPELLKDIWSKDLNIPIDNFGKVSIDNRTAGRPTYPTYHGVCVLYCGNIAVQRKLVYLARKFCEKIISKGAVSSAGRAFA
ncbi:MAG: hypothetical protein Q7S44_01130 [bacterium]|nr:hypothetical protein [bacterium]